MQEKLKNNKAITLVALVITIVIIIILSTIAFNFTFGENGLITKAQQAAEMTAVAQIQEQLEMAKGSAFIDGQGDIDPDHYFDILEEEGIIGDKETDVVNNGDGSYDVTTEGDRIFEVTPTPDGDMDIEYVGKNDEPRISQIVVTDKTDSSVTVEVVTKNVDNAEYTYSYRKTDEGEENWQQAGSGSDSTFTISGLENNTSYDIKVTVTTGDTTIEKTITVQIGTGVVEVPDGTITFGQVAWQGDGTANMPISTTEPSFTLQYQVGSTSGQWTTITSGQSITGLRHGNTVYARLTDGTDTNTSEVQQTTIQDTIPPVVSVSSDENTSSSIAVKVQVADNQSGMADTVTYTYYIKQSTQGEDNYQSPSGASNISENTYTFTDLTQNVSYDVKVEVKSDVAGNTGTGTLLNQTTGSIPGGDSALEDGSIMIGEPTWSDGHASIEVSTGTSYTLEYQVNGTDDNSWTAVSGGTISNLNHGDKVNIRLTDGENTGGYVTKEIQDTIPPEVNVTSSSTPTSNSISVSVSAQDNESGMAESLTYTYYIKQSSQNDDSYVAQATDIGQNTYTYTGLTQGTSYDVKVDVKSDKANNTGTGTLLKQVTASIPGGSGIVGNQITVGETVWADGKASITVSTDTSYSIEYQINGTSEGSWTNIGNSGTVPNLNYGDTVNIRLTDGNNHGDFVAVTIGDEIDPTVNVSLSNSTSNSISVNVNATDAESGMSSNPTYTYYIKQSSQGDGSYTSPEDAKDILANTYTFTELTQNTSYDIKVEVKADIAGNMGTGTLLNQTTSTIPGGDSILQDGTLTIGEPTWSSGQASITVSTNQSYQIEYQVNGTDDGSWKTVSGGTITGLNHGDNVNIRLTDGENAGGYVTKEITDATPPTVTVTAQGEPTSNSIAVSVSAQDNESGMASSLTYTYYIKQHSQGDESYLSPSGATEISQNTYTFTGLQQGTSYDVKVEVTGDVAGNTGFGTLLNQTTQSIPGGQTGVQQGAITFGTVSWSAGQASITVSTNTGYQIEYKLTNPEVDEGWTPIDNNGTIPNLGHGDTVYARLTDGNNHGDYATASIQDGIDPVVDVLANGAAKSNSISVSVTAQDNESGMASIPTYTYYIKQSSEADSEYKTQTNSTNLSTNTYTFTGLTQGTSYDIKVEVTGDNAGNTGTGYLAGQITATIPDASGPEVQEGAITFSTASWSNNKASITVSTNTSYQIEYQVGEIIEGSWTGVASGGTISNLEYGDMVYARLTDGVNHGEYASANIDDGIEPEASIEATEITSDSITVKVTASDAESGLATSETYKYYLDSESSPRETSTNDTYTYEGLNGKTSYTLKVIVTDIAGNTKEATTTATTKAEWDTSKVTATPSTDGKTVPVPIGYTASSASGETSVNDGFVIYEGTGEVNDGNVDGAKTTRNQFVWIPVDDISQIANQTSGTDANGRQNYQGKLYDFSTTGATEMNSYGQGTTSYREPDIVSDYDGSSKYLSELGLSNSNQFQTQLQEEFNEMIESVDTYGGFYIGRYETGNLVASANTKPVIVKGNRKINFTSWYVQYQNSKLIAANSKVVSTMAWGCMWDRTLIWLTETGDKTYSDLMDSRSWGNYKDSTGAAATNSGELQPTGNNETWKSNNIYDLAGNVRDNTIEACNTSDRVFRGGICSSSGSSLPVSSRLSGSPLLANSAIGSRSALFVAVPPDMSAAKPTEGEDGPTFSKNTPVSDDQGNTVVIPGGFHLDADSGTSVEEGIVIEDSDGNQFVWIPTGTYNVTMAVDSDDTKDGKMTNNLSRRTFTSSGATEVSGDTAINTYWYGEGNSNSVAYSQIGAFKDSVSRNDGFYIGRYEQGTENVVKAGVAPYTNITRDTAKSQIEAMYSGNSYVTSELISSYARDTALNFICQTNSAGYTLATTTDRTYGNFYQGSKQNTGAYEADNYSNIHDLLGNCQEWTTEYSSYRTSTGKYWRGVSTGGYYGYDGYSAASRCYTFESDSYDTISARAQLYVK